MKIKKLQEREGKALFYYCVFNHMNNIPSEKKSEIVQLSIKY